MNQEGSMADKEHPEDGRSGEIDFTEPTVVAGWLGQVDAHLDDSDRQALAEEISRQYRRAPSDVQTSGLKGELGRTEERLTWVIEQIETQESPEVRSQLGQLREQILEDIEGLRERIIELQIDEPDP
jgi:hypothetical protein